MYTDSTAFVTDSYATYDDIAASPEPSCCCTDTAAEAAWTDPVEAATYDSTYDTSYDTGFGTGYETGVSWELPPEPPLPATGPDTGSFGVESVIPAGQPGGPTPAAVVGYDALYPSVATIGGTEPVSIDVGDGFYPSMATIGGHEPPTFTFVDPGVGYTSPDVIMPSPSYTTIGPAPQGSTLDNLANLYGMAADNGDIMSQVLLVKTIDSIQDSSAIWAF